MPDLSIRPLNPDDADALAALLQSEEPGYLRHFHPFPFDAAAIRERLAAAKRDRFWAVWAGAEIGGFFMLRGFDAGFARPAFGVFIASRQRGRGLAKVALHFALAWCRLNAIAEVMLKVHPQNAAARAAYRAAGFQPQGICPDTGHEIFVKSWK